MIYNLKGESMNKKLAIVIPVYNNFQYTKNALKDLLQLPDNHHIVVVDNCSTDATKTLQSTTKLTVIRTQENLGFGKACNQGFDWAKINGYEHVMFLNNDIKINQIDQIDWTEQIISECDKGNIVGPTIGCLDKDFRFVCETKKIPSRGLWYMSGWCISAPVVVWAQLIEQDEIGPFRIFFAYFEDSDLSLRAKLHGFNFSVIDIPVKHFGKATGEKLNISNMYLTSYGIFNNIWGERKAEIGL
jgi:GT2 family glycosyltransferase